MSRRKPARADRLEWRPIDELRAHPDNTRLHGEEQLDQLRQSLRQFGWTRPIMVTDTTRGLPKGTIFVGHGFWEAAKAEGHTQAKVLVAEHWSPELIRGYMIADNALPLLADWDEEKLNEQLRRLNAEGFDMATLGFSKDDLDARLAAFLAGEGETGQAGSLAAKFGVPPFTVLSAREGWWQDRKAAWLKLGIASELGRGFGISGGASPGGSPRPLDRAKGKRRATATPGGSAMPAADYRKGKRGDGRGRAAP